MSILGDDPGLASESKFNSVKKGTQGKTTYSCKKCRRVVALEENVVSHLPGEKEAAFNWGKQSFGAQFNEFQDIECTSLFVEPLKWMTAGKNVHTFQIGYLYTYVVLSFYDIMQYHVLIQLPFYPYS